MRWRKRLTILLLLVVLSLMICACGPTKSGEAATASSGAASETISGEDAEANMEANDAGYQEDDYKDN